LAGLFKRRPVQETQSLEVDHRADLAGPAQVSRDARDVLEQAFLLDGIERGLGHGAGHRAAAEGGAQVLGLERSGDRGVSNSADTGKPLPSAFAVVIMSGITP
jgi:hypothetical protein